MVISSKPTPQPQAFEPAAIMKFLLVEPCLHPSVRHPIKRLIDIIGSLIGLGLTAILFVPIALLIRMDSQGPILFRQTRVGVQGKPFQILKFRTMVSDADQKKHLVPNQAQGHIFKNEHDPRVTRIGRFLRKTSLDEFPQFWNVLLGEMSLVGTRPPTLDEVKQYQSHHWLRLNVKPGITGEWQVRGRSDVKDFENVVALDLQYQTNWSILYDLVLILQTITVVLARKGAV